MIFVAHQLGGNIKRDNAFTYWHIDIYSFEHTATAQIVQLCSDLMLTVPHAAYSFIHSIMYAFI